MLNSNRHEKKNRLQELDAIEMGSHGNLPNKKVSSKSIHTVESSEVTTQKNQSNWELPLFLKSVKKIDLSYTYFTFTKYIKRMSFNVKNFDALLWRWAI